MSLPRSEAKRLFEKLGARVSGTVSPQTDLLLVGAAPGAKKKNAALTKGVPQMHWVFFKACGFAEPRGTYRLKVPPTDFSTLLLITATLAEELFADAIQTKSPSRLATSRRALRAVDLLLQAAYEPSDGENEGGSQRTNPGTCVCLQAGIRELIGVLGEIGG